MQLTSEIDESKSSLLQVTNIEHPSRKALLDRAILEAKSVDNKLAFSAGCHWDAYLRKARNYHLADDFPGSDPFCKLFGMFVEKTDAMELMLNQGRNILHLSEELSLLAKLKTNSQNHLSNLPLSQPYSLNHISFLDEIVKNARPELKGRLIYRKYNANKMYFGIQKTTLVKINDSFASIFS